MPHARRCASTRRNGSAGWRFPAATSGPTCGRAWTGATDCCRIFRVSAAAPPAYAEFADARTILRLNATRLGRDAAMARPGDLLAFHQPGQRFPEHLMVFVGRSSFEPDRDDWVVYHTGPDAATHSAGEMRKATLADLRRHPAPRWRPLRDNPAFLGVYRLRIP